MQITEVYMSGYDVNEIVKHKFSQVLGCYTLFTTIWPIVH